MIRHSLKSNFLSGFYMIEIGIRMIIRSMLLSAMLSSALFSKPDLVGNAEGDCGIGSDYLTYWNQLTPRYNGKWDRIERESDVMSWGNLDRLYDYAKANKIAFKQHTFLDVVNEPTKAAVTPIARNAIGGDGVSGWDRVVWCLEKARRYAPNAKLLINDYDALKHSNATATYLSVIAYLVRKDESRRPARDRIIAYMRSNAPIPGPPPTPARTSSRTQTPRANLLIKGDFSARTTNWSATTIATKNRGFHASTRVDVKADNYFGNIWQLWDKTEDAEPRFTELFNQVTTQKWGQWSRVEPTRGKYIWGPLDALCGWADQTGSLVKEHCFIWHNSEPEWLDITKAPYNEPDSVKAMVYKWMSDYLRRYGSKTQMIDVLNEPIEGNNKLKIKGLLGGSGATGWDWVVWPYQIARELCNQYAPNAKLILNEYGLLASDTKTTRFLEIVEVLQDRSLIDGIGEQGHFYEGVVFKPGDAQYVDIATIRRNLNRLAATGLPIHISEFDMSLADDEEQLRAYEILFPILWEHPSVAGVTLWGYLKEDMWRPKAYLVRPDGTERPALTWLRSYLGM